MLTASVSVRKLVQVASHCMAGRWLRQERVSAAAIGTGIASLELLEIELLRRKSRARAGLRARRAKIPLVGGIPAPFAEATPEAAQRARDGFRNAPHQSSPCAAPV